MEFNLKSGSPEKQRTSCLVLGIHEPRMLSGAAEQFDRACQGYLAKLLRRAEIEGKVGQNLLLFQPPENALCDRILLIGCGPEQDLDGRRFLQIVANAANALKDTGVAEAFSCLPDLNVKDRDTHWKVRQAIVVTEETLYRFDELKSKKEQLRLQKIILSIPSRRELTCGEQAIREGKAIAAAAKLAKDLSNRPANICHPTYLAECAIELSQTFPTLKTKILEAADMEQLGMGSLLSVSWGSIQPPKLIILEYLCGHENLKPIVLIGKGVTFDSGGISLKSRDKMDEMKYDMCGAASVLGTLQACAELTLSLNVVGIIPAVENMPGGRATKPGDIVTSLSGQTIEVLNTDAEGRLLLCDAMTYSERYNPGVVIDIATLTGACIIALGHHPHGLFSNHGPLAKDLLNAGYKVADRAWELPLWEEYQEQLDSNFADMANVGGRDAGAITAACFLARFAKKFNWAHLDIAGTAWKTGKSKGATGRPVPLLVQYLLDRAIEASRG